jgi:hypothetical protein
LLLQGHRNYTNYDALSGNVGVEPLDKCINVVILGDMYAPGASIFEAKVVGFV